MQQGFLCVAVHRAVALLRAKNAADVALYPLQKAHSPGVTKSRLKTLLLLYLGPTSL